MVLSLWDEGTRRGPGGLAPPRLTQTHTDHLLAGAATWKRVPTLGLESLGLNIQFCHAAVTRVSVAAATRARLASWRAFLVVRELGSF